MAKYWYVHKDGRQASSEKGTWQAMSEVLGKEEASNLLDQGYTTSWISIPYDEAHDATMQSELVIRSTDEVAGTFYK